MSTLIFFVLHLSILAYAVVAGVFLAFSDFIMRALAKTSGHGGVEAMQAINREVFRWVFMTLFLGLAPLSLAISAYATFALTGPAATLITAAGAAYLLGCFAVTVFGNVPMNERLAGMDTTASATRDYWLGTYVPRWRFWNSVRTAACLISAALLMAGVYWLAPGPMQTDCRP